VTDPVTGNRTVGGPLSFGAAALAPVWQLNSRFLEALVDCASRPDWVGSAWEAALGPHVSLTPPEVLGELSRCPVSLVDPGLTNWAPATPGAAPEVLPARAPTCVLPPIVATELTQAALTLAWTLSRSDVAAASVVFGISLAQGTGVARLSLQAIQAAAARQANELQPRWMSEPRIWCRLLGTKPRAPSPHFAPLGIRLLQRQFSDLVPATFATRPTRNLRR
jgi:hypothetical protein